MASPHVAGVAALRGRRIRPGASRTSRRRSSTPAIRRGRRRLGYRISRGGTGLVQPAKSTTTQVVALGEQAASSVSLNFGFEELKTNFSKTKTITAEQQRLARRRRSTSRSTNQAGSPHTRRAVALRRASSVTVPAGQHSDVDVTLNVPVATAGNSGRRSARSPGSITFTPASRGGQQRRHAARAVLPRAAGAVERLDEARRKLQRSGRRATATVTNKGRRSRATPTSTRGASRTRGAGQGVERHPRRRRPVVPVPRGDRAADRLRGQRPQPLVERGDERVRHPVDVNGDGNDDYIVVGVDQGAVQTGMFNGVMGAFVFSTRSAGATHRLPRHRAARQLDDPAAGPEQRSCAGPASRA